MAKHYGLLPSEVLRRATTFDLMVYDVSMSWERYIQNKANGTDEPPELSQEEMLKLVRKPKNGG